eukprot:scaffold40142_cov15-Tisochrysis_lutea.AAC.1
MDGGKRYSESSLDCSCKQNRYCKQGLWMQQGCKRQAWARRVITGYMLWTHAFRAYDPAAAKCTPAGKTVGAPFFSGNSPLKALAQVLSVLHQLLHALGI